MKYRTGQSYWRAIASARPSPPGLADDICCEVAVIGGGITGALVAFKLVEQGLATVLVDRREFATESTAASTGLLLYEVDTPLVELIAKVGQECAVRAYRRGLVAIDELETLAERLGGACNFSRRACLYFASSEREVPALAAEYECQRYFHFPVELLNARQLAACTSIPAPLALRSHGDAQIDPYCFTCSLLERAQAAGLRTFANTLVTEVEQQASAPLLRTANGTIRARHVVYAAGYASDGYLQRRLGERHSTYVVASEPLGSFAGWPEGCLIWETARPYFYARQTADGRAMIGGEDTPFADDHRRDALVERQSERLRARFAELFPQLSFSPAFAWAGTFADTHDGLAFIGRPRHSEHEYYAVGYGGNGITFSMIAAQLICDLILGRPNPDAEVFRFGR